MDKSNFLYPLKLVPALKSALWGGRRLIEKYGKSYDGERLAEAWELSSRTPSDSSMIENGAKAGVLLCDYFADYGNVLVGTKHTGDRFPLLVKWIDATDKLSVQVHPDDGYAKEHEGELGKTELWYIAEAKEGARLVYGLLDGVGKEQLSEAMERGRAGDVIKEIPVKAGDAVFIPSGMLHAIGEGIVIAEIQQNSDLTYRFFDYDRRDAEGRLRKLHIDKAIDVVRTFSEEQISAVRYAGATEEEKRDPSVLCVCPYFRTDVLTLNGWHTLFAAEDSFVHLLCTEGEGILRFRKMEYPFHKGDSYLLPATLGECFVFGNACLLLTRLC